MRPNILLVDDDPRNLFALSALLETLPASMLVAQSGEEALRQLLRHEVAAVVLDVRMRGIDGFETAAAIRSLERFRRTPIIFLSAQPDRRIGPRDEFCEFLLKPVEPEVIRPKLDAYLARYREQATDVPGT